MSPDRSLYALVDMEWLSSD